MDLTAKDIEELPPSRETDGLVATRLLRWRNLRSVWASGCDCSGQFVWVGVPPDGDGEEVLLYFTTSIASAWPLLEELRRRDGGTSLSLEYSWGYGVDRKEGWCVVVGGVVQVTFAETAPLAICRAALRERLGC